jgi:hypothetical protein
VTGILADAVDLFGLPILPERGKGRPSHVWTSENSKKVSLLFACGHKPIEVARVLGISKPTFYKHYFNEISRAGHAPLMMRAIQLARLNEQAEKGNVAAEKALAGMIQAEQIRTLGERVAVRGSAKRETAAPALGKKEQAKASAKNVTGRFGTRQPPLMLQ